MKRLTEFFSMRGGTLLVLLLAMALLVACGDNDNGETAVPSDPAANPTAAVETAEATPLAVTPTTDPETADPQPAVEEQAAEETAVSEDEPAAAASTVQFEIDSELSEARFLIGEILRGEPFTVVGVTNAVEGSLSINFADPTQTEIGEISVDASTLVTDSSMRNRAIYNFVLNTSQFQHVRFTPTNLIGLPTAVAIGERITFQIEGDLTIRDISRPVLFDAVVDLVSETELRGQATTVILRDDYNLTIPRVPQVASVDEDLTLEIEFVATAVQP